MIARACLIALLGSGLANAAAMTTTTSPTEATFTKVPIMFRVIIAAGPAGVQTVDFDICIRYVVAVS